MTGPIRAAEGLDSVTGVLRGKSPEALEVQVNEIPFLADLREGQKTGLYVDQADNYTAVARLAKGKRVLDCFCNQGGFALAAAQAGATSVCGVDVSGTALEMAKKNADRANIAADTGVEWVEANVFDFLRSASDEAANTENWEASYDLIILDPPSFARSKKNVREAMRGYKEIHLRALKLLAPGGILATFSCSHHVSRDDLRSVAVDAAVDAKRTLREVESYRQRADHPVLPGIPETEYLQGFAFEIVPAW